MRREIQPAPSHTLWQLNLVPKTQRPLNRVASGEGGTLAFLNGNLSTNPFPLLTSARLDGLAYDVAGRLLHPTGVDFGILASYFRPSVGITASVNQDRRKFLASLDARGKPVCSSSA